MNMAIITGIGTAVPEHTIAQSDAADQMAAYSALNEDQTRTLTRLYRNSGVQTRHSVLLRSSTNGQAAHFDFHRASSPPEPGTEHRMQIYETCAAPLALTASGRAMTQSRTHPREVTHLVTVSCSGFSSPGVDLSLVRELNLRATVERTHVGFMGCHGALNGVRVAKAIVESQPQACVLVCAVELCTLHMQRGFSMQRTVSSSLFADGAAAVVCRSSESPGPDRTDSHGPSTALPIAATGACVIPDSVDAMTWRITDHGFEMTLSPKVPQLILEHLSAWSTEWLSQRGMTTSDIRSWAIHPGGPRILQACTQALAISHAAVAPSEAVLAQFGNMSSPTVLFILQRLWQDATEYGHELLPAVALGFGPGLAVEAVLLAEE